jgi:TonB family protein
LSEEISTLQFSGHEGATIGPELPLSVFGLKPQPVRMGTPVLRPFLRAGMRQRILGRESMLHVEEIRPFRVAQAPHNRLATIAIVVGIHVAVIAAFMLSLHPNFFPKETPGPIQSRVIIEPKHTDDAFTKAPAVTLRTVDTTEPDKPVIQIEETPPSSGIGAVQGPPIGPINPLIRDFGPRAIAGTHTIPDYPPLDTRLGHEGSVMLRLAIDERGTVVDAVVERSSGYASLDKAAADWVKAHWRYYPATHNGDAMASAAEVTVSFHLTGH